MELCDVRGGGFTCFGSGVDKYIVDPGISRVLVKETCVSTMSLMSIILVFKLSGCSLMVATSSSVDS